MTVKQVLKNLQALENLRIMQENGVLLPCPRCGHNCMKPNPIQNALSRRASVYICNQCGMDEALLDMTGQPPFPLTEWSMIVSLRGQCQDKPQPKIKTTKRGESNVSAVVVASHSRYGNR